MTELGDDHRIIRRIRRNVAFFVTDFTLHSFPPQAYKIISSSRRSALIHFCSHIDYVIEAHVAKRIRGDLISNYR